MSNLLSQNPPQLTAVIRNEANDGWLKYDEPVKVLRAQKLDDVVPALTAIEQASEDGLTAIGYVSYESASAFDSALVTHSSDSPLLLFGLYKEGVEYRLDRAVCSALSMDAVTSQLEYSDQFEKVKTYLGQGDSYQVNLTHRLRAKFQQNPEAVFADLFSRQAAPGSVLLYDQDHAICSVTPELFFALDGERITMEPMKGTRPRSKNPARDAELREELRQSEKERAENLMIVDLIRNDLGKIAHPGSVRADALFEIMELPTLWQQISKVSASTQAGLVEIFQALFPCASVTGAPKRRTMEIIHELETTPRGVYTGAIGIVRPNRKMNFGVGIRTLIVDRINEAAEYSVGSGIVWDSDSASEWEETLVKAAVLNDNSHENDFELLETMRFSPKHGIDLLDFHLQRLETSARELGFCCDIAEIEFRLSQFNHKSERKLRLLLDKNGSVALEDHAAPPIEQAVTLKLAAQAVDRHNLTLRHKTSNREIYARACEGDRNSENCDDVILFNEAGELTETTISNLYLEIDGVLLTPKLSSGLLAGTYRRKLIEAGEAIEAILTLNDLKRASRLFVSNSVRGFCKGKLIED